MSGTVLTPVLTAAEQATQRSRNALARRMHKLLLVQADRDDLLLEMLWEDEQIAKAPAAAFFEPARAVVSLQPVLGLNGVDPAEADPRTPAGRKKIAALVGMQSHEASHSHSTPHTEAWHAARRALTGAQFTALTNLEESRIEHRQIVRRPQDRPYLRASARLILGDVAEWVATVDGSSRAQAAHSTALILGRAAGGIFTAAEVAPVREVLVAELGEDLSALEDVLAQFVELADDDHEQMLALARTWAEIVGVDPEQDAPTGCSAEHSPEGEDSEDSDGEGQDGDADGEGAEGDSASGSGSGTEDDAEAEESPAQAARKVFGKKLSEAIEETTEDAATADEGDSTPARTVPTKHIEAAAIRAEDNAEHAEAEKVAQKVFADSDTVSHGASDYAHTRVFRGERGPSQDERSTARKIGMALRGAQFRDRTSTTVASVLPPGRLNGRAAMLGTAQRSLGMPVTAKPFRARVTRRAPEPPMTLAFAFDISGSMGWAEDVLASMAWSFSHASTYVKGRSASVLFGSKVHALVHPGRTPEKVREFNAHDGMEDFIGAFAALDGALNLVRGDGVRLLTVISDGYFGAAGQARGTQKAIDRFVRSGGQVLWIGQEGTHFPDKVIRVEIDTREVAKVPEVVTAALTTALRRAA